MTALAVEEQAASRTRAIAVVLAGAVILSGALTALISTYWLITTLVVLFIVVAGLTAPLEWVAVGLAALVPLQIYFAVPDSTFNLRAPVILAGIAAARILMSRPKAGARTRTPLWMCFAGAFLLAAGVAAVGAPNPYLGLRGVFDWVIIFAVAWVVHATNDEGTRKAIVVALIAGGLAEAVVGLAEYAAGLDQVLDWLKTPAATIFLQPNLLREKLADLSFNWVVFDRASPFGTFINGIDYAVFLAAILSLVLVLWPAWSGQRTIWVLGGCALLMGAALLLTYKGSGWAAWGGGIATILVVRAVTHSQISRLRTIIFPAVLVALFALLLAAPFWQVIGERLTFLVAREQGAFGTAGRLAIWANLLESFAQRPIFGYGLNNGTLLSEPMRTLRDGLVAYNATPPESGYVALLVETGIAGFAAWAGMVANVLVRAYRTIRESADPRWGIGLSAAFVALLVGNVTVTGFTGDQNGLLLGILIGLLGGAWDKL